MGDLLTWRKSLAAVAILGGLPLLLPPGLGELTPAFGAAVVAVLCFVIQRRARENKSWLRWVGAGNATAVFITLSLIWESPASGYAVVIFGALTAGLYLAALVCQLRVRRPDGYLDGIFDGCAAFLGLMVVICQWQAFQPGATALSILSPVIPFAGLFVSAALVGIIVGLLRDDRQSRKVLAAIVMQSVMIMVSAVLSRGWSTPDSPFFITAAALLHNWFLAAAVLHPDHRLQFLREKHSKSGTMISWLGPASALMTTPVMMALFVFQGEVPTLGVGVACTLLAGVALWRGGRVLQEREQGRRELKAELKFRKLVEHSSDVVFILDGSHRIVFASGGIAGLLGVTASSVEGRRLSSFVADADVDELNQLMNGELLSGDSQQFHRDVPLQRNDGVVRWVTFNITDHRTTPSIHGWVLNVHDVTERKKVEAALSRLALHDSLTGLPNRTQMRDRLETAIRALPGRTALLFCDLDGFKAVNDILGHETGDEVLRSVAGRWSTRLRSHDVLGRWGGDEFLVICPDVGSVDQASVIAERLLAALADPLELTNGHAQLGCSVGVALHDGAESVETLIGRADAAMYAAKRVEGGLRVA